MSVTPGGRGDSSRRARKGVDEVENGVIYMMGNGFLRAMVIVLTLVLTGVSAESGPIDVQLYPQHSYVAPAELCTLEVYVTAPADSLACMEVFLQFDNSLLTLVSVLEGTLFENAGYQTFFRWDDFAPDTVSAVDCVFTRRSYFLAPGDLVRFVFQALQLGVAGVNIAAIKLWDIDREELFPVVDPAGWIHIGPPASGVPPPSPAGSLECFPNPFNPATTLRLNLPPGEMNGVDVSIYSPSGSRIATLFEGDCHHGDCRFEWRGVDDAGRRVASGVYFAVARTTGAVYTTKLVLIE